MCLSVALQCSHLTRVIIKDKCQKLTAVREVTPLTVLWSLSLCGPIHFVPQLSRSAHSSEMWGGARSGDVERQQQHPYPEEAFPLDITMSHLLRNMPWYCFRGPSTTVDAPFFLRAPLPQPPKKQCLLFLPKVIFPGQQLLLQNFQPQLLIVSQIPFP